ncbi:MAG: Bug family tripartite tricarboxylate transporter substrate binding protein [Pigmentiphaga sp.]
MIRISRSILATCILSIASALSGPASAQAVNDFPSRAITIIVPFPPGGSSDRVVRLIARQLQENTGQSVIVDNRPGGNGFIGIQALRRAAPDGHTVFMGHAATHSINPAMMNELPYDPIKDFAPITTFMSFPSVLMVPADSPDQSVADLLARARDTQGGLTYSSQGIGTAGHILGAMLESATGPWFLHVPMPGAAGAVTEVVAGRVDMIFSSYITAGGFVKDGRLRMLAIASPQRSEALPDLPTMEEAGVAGVDQDYWFGFFAPAETPEPIVRRLNEEFVKAIRSPDVQGMLTSQAANVLTATPEEFAQLIEADIERMQTLVKTAGLKNE